MLNKSNILASKYIIIILLYYSTISNPHLRFGNWTCRIKRDPTPLIIIKPPSAPESSGEPRCRLGYSDRSPRTAPATRDLLSNRPLLRRTPVPPGDSEGSLRSPCYGDGAQIVIRLQDTCPWRHKQKQLGTPRIHKPKYSVFRNFLPYSMLIFHWETVGKYETVCTITDLALKRKPSHSKPSWDSTSSARNFLFLRHITIQFYRV